MNFTDLLALKLSSAVVTSQDLSIDSKFCWLKSCETVLLLLSYLTDPGKLHGSRSSTLYNNNKNYVGIAFFLKHAVGTGNHITASR